VGRRPARVPVVLAAAALAGCAAGPPRYGPAPVPEGEAEAPRPRDERPIAGDILVRVGLHWERGAVRIRAPVGDLRLDGTARPDAAAGIEIRASGNLVALSVPGAPEEQQTALRADAGAGHPLVVGSRTVRGWIEASARADSLFVVNVVPLEDYLRGVVPREIGARPEGEREAVAAQAVAARTYTVKRLGQYGSLPFDVFADVRDQVYEGIAGEDPVADAAVRETRGLVLDTADGLLEAYYSSTCGGARGDIVTVWPHRAPGDALRGGPDGAEGREWCRDSPHFRWTERWTGKELSALVRAHLPGALELPAGSVGGELVDVRVARRDASGRAAEILYETTSGSWRVPGDRNRWILRRGGGAILRSTKVDLEVRRSDGRVVEVRARGAGNGHGVGMCQTGALGRARAGAAFREILEAYYPTARLRALRGSDVPPGRGAAS
jgi:stage II sporulation protein D